MASSYKILIQAVVNKVKSEYKHLGSKILGKDYMTRRELLVCVLQNQICHILTQLNIMHLIRHSYLILDCNLNQCETI